MEDDLYTKTVNRIRISHDTDGWTLDGVNTETGKHTEDAWRFLSRTDARDNVAAFVSNLRSNEGVIVSATYELDLGHTAPADRTHFAVDAETFDKFTELLDRPTIDKPKLAAFMARRPPWEPIPGNATVNYRNTL